MNLAQLQQWQPYVNLLHTAAKNESDPETYANMILDQLPIDTVETVVANAENYEKLFAFVPQLGEFRQWFDELREVVLALIALERQEVDDKGGDLGDVHGEHEQPNISG